MSRRVSPVEPVAGGAEMQDWLLRTATFSIAGIKLTMFAPPGDGQLAPGPPNEMPAG